MKDLAFGIRQQLQTQLPLFIFVFVLFAMGVLFGAFLVQALTLEQKEEMSRHLGSFFQSVMLDEPGSGQSSAFLAAFSLHVKWLVLIWLLGLSVIGLPFVLLLDFLKGVLVGFTVGYLTGQLSWKGLLVAMIAVLPQNLLVVPALMALSAASVVFSFQLVKYRLLQHPGIGLKPAFGRYARTAALAAAAVAFAALFEAYASPYLLQWISPMAAAGLKG